MPPLLSVNRPQILFVSFISPFIPNCHLIILEEACVADPSEKPQQFVDDGAEMNLLRCDQRKSAGQTVARLRAENGIRARAGAVGLELSVFEDVPQQIEILNHRGKNLTTKSAKEKEI